MRIGAIADDERHALIGKGGGCDQCADQKREQTEHAIAFTHERRQGIAAKAMGDKKTPRLRAGSEGVWGTDMTGRSQSVSDH
jgi:hypothetical protein